MGRSIPWDAVLSYHMNPLTCGVQKFNVQLAERLGIPCLPLGSPCQHPLISVKSAEMNGAWATAVPIDKPWTLLLHDRPTDVPRYTYGRVFYADEIGCPSTIQGNPTRGTINVLTFGMAHKIQAQKYQRLKELLDATGEDYTVSLSTAIHEGSSWEDVGTVADEMRAIFGERLRVLGYLADDALAKELQDCTAVALFYEPAVRANNTTFWAALDAGAVVIANRDERSPQVGGWYDIHDLVTFPDADYRRGHRAQAGAFARYSWDAVIEQLCAS